MKKLVVAFALVAMLFQQQVAQAQAVPVWAAPAFTGAVNRAIGSGIAANLARRGITVAANDAAFASTMSFVGKAANDASAVSSAAGAAASILGAPVWMSALISVGALAAAGAVAWGAYKLTQSGGSSAPTLTLAPSSSGTGTSPTQGQPMPSGSYQLYQTSSCDSFTTTCPPLAGLPTVVPSYLPYETSIDQYTVVAGVSGIDLAQQVGAVLEARQGCFGSPGPSGSLATNCVLSYQDKGQQGVIGGQPTEWYVVRLDYNAMVIDENGNQQVGAAGFVTGGGNGIIPNYGYVAPPSTSPTTGTLQSLPVTQDMLNQSFPQSLTASLADSLWRQAASQPGYTGYPYDATNPVSQSDVATAPTPSWRDVTDSLPAPQGSTSVPISNQPIPYTPYTPGQTGSTNPASSTTSTSTSNQCQLNPTASACQPLGTAPASPPIPTSSASVSMNPWSIGAADGVCPAPQVVSVLGSNLSLSWDPVCGFVQKVRPLILAICALAAALIVAMGVSL